MTTYKIYEKATGSFCYEYGADAPVEWNEYPFELFDHQPQPPTMSDSPPVFGGRRKLTKLEWRKLLLPVEEQAFDKIRATVETVPLPSEALRDAIRTNVNKFDEATVMDLDDPDQSKGLQLLVSLGKMDPSRIGVILNG